MLGRLCLAAFAPFLLAGPAAAGPIAWRYTAAVQTTTGLGTLDLGTDRMWPEGVTPWPGGVPTVDYRFTAPLPSQTLSGAYPGQPNDPVPILAVGRGYAANPVATAPPADPAFRVTFTLTDLASGESGTIEFGGGAGVSTTHVFPPRLHIYAGLSSFTGTEELFLGANRYRVTPVDGWAAEADEPAAVGLRVEAFAATPEPGTLALAGLGLAGAGLARARRRRRDLALTA